MGREEKQTTGVTPSPMIIFTVLGCLVVWSIVISCRWMDISSDMALHFHSSCHEGVWCTRTACTPVGRDLVRAGLQSGLCHGTTGNAWSRLNPFER